jgi:Rieske Fe-S protein
MANTPPDEARRDWLLLSLTGAIAATLIAIFYPVARFLRPRRATVSGAAEATAPFKVNDIQTTKVNPFNFGGKPCLIVLTAEGARRLAAGERMRPDDVRAFSAVCTHVDCTVKFRKERQDIFCSCHEGIYDLNGRNVSGPPPRPLEQFKVTLRGEPGKEEIVVARQT